jgi:hypothetical protein
MILILQVLKRKLLTSRYIDQEDCDTDASSLTAKIT